MVLSFDPSDIIKPRDVENRDLEIERKKMMAMRKNEVTNMGAMSHAPPLPPQEFLQNMEHENIISPENLSISLMMSKQRGRPSKKFRSQIERLRTRQTIQLAEEEEEEYRKNTLYFGPSSTSHHHHHPIAAGPKHGRYPPRKHWVNELNVDIASRQHPEVPMSSPVYRAKERAGGERERTSSASSDVELISPRRNIEVHSPLRQGRRIYPSTRDAHGLNGFVPDAFVPILPKTMKPSHHTSQHEKQHQHQHHQKHQQSHCSKQEVCGGFKIQSVRSLADSEEQHQPHSHTPTPASKMHTSATAASHYVHYPYNNGGAAVATSYDYAQTRYYSLSDSNKLVQVSTLPSSTSSGAADNNSKTNSSYKNTQSHKNAFKDATFSMRTFRHDQMPAENNSYKIKSAALKNHEPYIIHHPSHLNRGYREIPGQYPVIYTHQPLISAGAGRYAVKGGPEYAQHATNVGFVYERVHPRYDKISPRSSGDKIRPRGDKRLPTTTTYVKYIESPPPPPVPPLQRWTELQKVGSNA